jgi:phage FluMu protein Com
MKAIGCKKCNRILWEKDADKDGLCPDCRETPVPEPKKKDDKKKGD